MSAPEWSFSISPTNGVERTSSVEKDGVITTIVKQTVPQGIEPADAHLALLRAARDREDEDAEAIRRTVSVLGPIGDITSVIEMNRYPAIREILGYDVAQITEDEDSDKQVIRITFQYPSIATVNTFLDEVSPDEGLRFRGSPGSLYTFFDATEAFADGYWLVAEEQPHQIHEHAALHVLGAMGLTDTVIAPHQSFVQIVLARAAAEKTLPAIPGLSTYPQHASFLNPSRVLARAFGGQLDIATSGIGNLMFANAADSFDRITLTNRLDDYLRALYDTPSAQEFVNVPDRVRGSSLKLQKHGRAVYDRYQMLEERADALLA